MEKIVVKDEDEWLALRKTVITASEVGCLMGLNPYQTMTQAWKEKEVRTFHGNSLTLIGQILEPVVCHCAGLMLQKEFRLFEENPGEKVFFIDEKNQLGATPDAYCVDEKILLECKTTQPENMYRYSQLPPPYYIMQVHAQLHCCQYKKGYLTILGTDLTQRSGKDFVLPISIFEVNYSKGLSHVMCREAGRFREAMAAGKQFKLSYGSRPEIQMRLKSSYRKVV